MIRNGNRRQAHDIAAVLSFVLGGLMAKRWGDNKHSLPNTYTRACSHADTHASARLLRVYGAAAVRGPESPPAEPWLQTCDGWLLTVQPLRWCVCVCSYRVCLFVHLSRCRALNSGKFMPAGLVTVLSALAGVLNTQAAINLRVATA